jgi:hypothetical protein
MISAFLLFGLYSIDVVGLSLSEAARSAPAMLLLASLLQSAVLSYPIVRARWSGWRLAGATFLLFYGVTTLMVVIEAVYLPDAMPPDLVLRLLVNGAFTSAVFSPMVVLIHGRMRSRAELQQTNPRLVMPWYQWLLRCALIAFSWAVIFVVFGALVYLPLAGALDPRALQSSTDTDLPTWVLPFQMLRALVWTALTLPIIRMMKGGWWETGLTVALLYSVLMGSGLLMPTDMSPGLQLAHLIEVAGEAFVFGWLVVVLLHRRTERPEKRLVSSVRGRA